MSRRALIFIVSVFKLVGDWSGIGSEQEAINRSEPPNSLFLERFWHKFKLRSQNKVGKNCSFHFCGEKCCEMYLKINRSVKTLLNRPSIGVAVFWWWVANMNIYPVVLPDRTGVHNNCRSEWASRINSTSSETNLKRDEKKKNNQIGI